MEIQEKLVELFRDFVESVDTRKGSQFRGYLDYALRYHEVIKRFGRFLDRNYTFSRDAMPEEECFLNQLGPSF